MRAIALDGHGLISRHPPRGRRDRQGGAAGVIVAGLAAAAAFGLLAGASPALAIGLALAVAVAVMMLSSLTVGIVVFTAGSFAEALQFGGAATAAKGLGGLLVLAWVAALARSDGPRLREFVSENRAVVTFGVALLTWSTISMAWAQSPSAALLGSSRWAQDLVLLPIVFTGVRRLAHVRWVAQAFVGGALVATLYGVVTGNTVDGSRLVGAIGDPNETAALMVASAFMGTALGLGARSVRGRSIAFASAACAFLGLVLTASRGGLVALGATAVVAVAVAGPWRRQIALLAAAGAVFVIGWFVLLAPASSVSHVTTTQTPRTTLWAVAERAIGANPIAGVGNDNFVLAAKNYLVKPGVTTRADQIVSSPHVAHNVYLEISADLGIVGLALFLAFVLVSLRAHLRAVSILHSAGHRSEEVLARALVVATAGLLAAAFFLSDEYSKWLFLLLALGPAMLHVARTDALRAGGRVG